MGASRVYDLGHLFSRTMCPPLRLRHTTRSDWPLCGTMTLHISADLKARATRHGLPIHFPFRDYKSISKTAEHAPRPQSKKTFNGAECARVHHVSGHAEKRSQAHVQYSSHTTATVLGAWAGLVFDHKDLKSTIRLPQASPGPAPQWYGCRSVDH
jgi:hypothetical protein